MYESPAVTIGMRTYERPELLRRALDDVARQTFPDWRLVVLNNGGDPSTVESVVSELEARALDRIEIVHSATRLRPGAAVNAALSAQHGEFVVIHDDDDTWHPEFLERTVAHLRASAEDVAAVAVRLDCVTEKVREDGAVDQLSRVPFTPNLERVNFQSVLIANPFPPIGLLVRAKQFVEIGGYDESLASAVDWRFLLRLLERNRVEVIREVLANYHLRPDADGSYSNIVADRRRMTVSDHQVAVEYLDEAMYRGELEPSDLALAVSVADRENRDRTNEMLDHIRVMRLLAGDIEFRSKQIRELLIHHDETFAAMRTVLAPVTVLARATRRLRRQRRRALLP